MKERLTSCACSLASKARRKFCSCEDQSEKETWRCPSGLSGGRKDSYWERLLLHSRSVEGKRSSLRSFGTLGKRERSEECSSQRGGWKGRRASITRPSPELKGGNGGEKKSKGGIRGGSWGDSVGRVSKISSVITSPPGGRDASGLLGQKDK